MTEGRWVVGFDGGGSGTRCWVADLRGEVRGRAEGGAANPRAVGMDRALAELGRVAEAALRQAGASPAEVVSVAAGLAGAVRPAVQQAVSEALGKRFGRARWVTVTHDARIALYAATGGAPGVVLLAGTGSVAYGVDGEGREARAGGWGYLLGDEGGGYDLGRRGLAAVLKAHDGTGPPTALASVLLAALQVEEPEAVLERVYPVPGESAAAGEARHVLAALADAVLATARQGDAVASNIVEEAACELAALVTAVWRRLRLGDRLTVYAFGSLMDLQGGFLLDRVRRRLLAAPGPERLELRRPAVAPVAGAVIMALQPVAGPARAAELLRRLDERSRRQV